MLKWLNDYFLGVESWDDFSPSDKLILVLLCIAFALAGALIVIYH